MFLLLLFFVRFYFPAVLFFCQCSSVPEFGNSEVSGQNPCGLIDLGFLRDFVLNISDPLSFFFFIT